MSPRVGVSGLCGTGQGFARQCARPVSVVLLRAWYSRTGTSSSVSAVETSAPLISVNPRPVRAGANVLHAVGNRLHDGIGEAVGRPRAEVLDHQIRLSCLKPSEFTTHFVDLIAPDEQ